MDHYNTAQICLNGHTVTTDTSDTSFTAPFCSRCGSSTITACPSCNSPIRGTYHIDRVFSFDDTYTPSAYCYSCGSPYPWTKEKLSVAKELIDEMAELSPDEQDKFNSSLPDIISDTPRTPLAATRINKYMKKISPIAKDGIKQLFFDITIEAAKKMIWPI